MTQPLTGRDISDMRRHHQRRKGEINGRRSWRNVFDTTVVFFVMLALFFTGFWVRGMYDKFSKKDTVHPAAIAQEYKSFRIGRH